MGSLLSYRKEYKGGGRTFSASDVSAGANVPGHRIQPLGVEGRIETS